MECKKVEWTRMGLRTWFPWQSPGALHLQSRTVICAFRQSCWKILIDCVTMLLQLVAKRSYVEKDRFPGLWGAEHYYHQPCDDSQIVVDVPPTEILGICLKEFQKNSLHLDDSLKEDGFCLILSSVVCTACALPKYKDQLVRATLYHFVFALIDSLSPFNMNLKAGLEKCVPTKDEVTS